MKLRIKGDSLRLRLTRGEVEELDERGAVEDRVRFGPAAALVYRVTCDHTATALAATFARDSIEIRVPDAEARDWCRTDRVTLENTQPIAPGETLRLVVEKDFACLAPRAGEDESDHFPHPGLGSQPDDS